MKPYVSIIILYTMYGGGVCMDIIVDLLRADNVHTIQKHYSQLCNHHNRNIDTYLLMLLMIFQFAGSEIGSIYLIK